MPSASIRWTSARLDGRHIGVITYLSLYVQNTLGYSPIQAGLRFLPLSQVSFAVAPSPAD